MSSFPRVLVRVATVVLGVLVATTLVMLPTPAVADTAPADPTDPATPRTVSADALPTVQINGVVWAQEVVGDTVYVGGEFTNARPAGSPAGQNTTPRANLLAYDIRTGQLRTGWVANTNGVVEDIDSSPDGSRIYAGGSFTTVNGITRRRIVALDPGTGAVINSFNPNPDARVRAIAATDQTVYFGGIFGSVGGVSRSRLAAARASDGAVLSWNPTASDNVSALIVSPDQSKVLVGGEFTQLNGSSNPGYGLGAVDAVTGALLPWDANSVVRNAVPTTGSATGAINAFSSDGQSVYATGYTFGRAGGTLEGVAKMNWDRGQLQWVEDCHGDTYGSYPMDDSVYAVGHAHYCGNLPDGFHQSEPWNFYRGMAFSKKTTQTLRTEYYGYSNWAGTPAPSILHWYPRIDSGSFTGQTQGAWAVTGNDDYVVAGGEFPRVNGTNQQGLVRFARVGIAPTSEGPELNGASTNPTVRGAGAGQVLVSWQSNWDRDNRELTYEVVRNNDLGNPIETRTIATADWDRPYQSYLDTGLTPGSTVTYRIVTRDADGNETRSNLISIDVPSSGSADAYARSVAEDGPQHYWRFSEGSGTTAAGYTGLQNLVTSAGVTRGVPGAVSGDPAATFNGSNHTAWNDGPAEPGKFWYTVEAWFNTTTNRGGKIVGFGNSQTGSSSSSRADRTLYMDNNGRINFGSIQNNNRQVVTSQSGLANGQWHHAVGVQSKDGMSLYVDGQLVGSRNDIRTGRSYDGWWRVGGDNLSGWWFDPTSDYFAGSIDEVAVYSHALTGNQVRAHYAASGRSAGQPPADAYGQAVHGDGPDSYWRLAETAGTNASDASLNGRGADYVNGPTLGGASGIGLGSDRSVTLDGSNDTVSADNPVTSPERFAAETWFRTTTGSGGRLMGFGSSRTGTSTTTDRHVYMTNDGRLRFGTLHGTTRTTVESTQPYNDGDWHHLVAMQGTSGMELYVDGVLVASNDVSINTSYSGYWRLGGDNLSGWSSRPSSDYFAGSMDEAATYSRVLTPAEITDHYAKGGGAVNQSPVADFTATVDDLEVTFDSSASSDPDGTIASRSWSFGDGNTSTASNPTHTYGAGGNYQVTLTVTDDQGAIDTFTDTVTVSPANQAPVASFSTSTSGLSVSVDASGSSDPDGSIASYSWEWGDGSADGSGVTASHPYGSADTYTVTLTVTDDDGESASTTRQVTVAAPSGPFAADTFSRTASGGWGTADAGGSWTPAALAARWSVSGGRGNYNAPSAGTGHWSWLTSVSQADVDGTVDVTMDKPVTGSGISWVVGARRNGDSRYQFVTRVLGTREIQAWVAAEVNGSATVIGPKVTVPGTFNDGDVLRTRFRVTGSSPASLAMKVWKVGDAEPASWQVERTDSSAALAGAGEIGLYSYLFGSATNAPVQTSWDNLSVTAP